MSVKPTFVNFSRTAGSRVSTLERIEEQVCSRWGARLTGYALMQPSDDPYEGGYEMTDEGQIPCADRSVISDLITGNRPFGLVYLVPSAKSYFYLHFTGQDDAGHVVSIDTDRTMVYYKDDEHPAAGLWFERWLISLLGAVSADVCAYGTREVPEQMRPGEALRDFLKRTRPATDAFLQRRLYDPLDPDAVLDELRYGRLPEYPREVFHAIKYELITPFEIKKILREKPRHEGLVYKIAPGYHILSNIVYPPKGPSIPL